MKLNTYFVNNEKFKVRTMRIGSHLWMHVNGQLWIIDTKAPGLNHSRGSGQSATKTEITSGEIFSPMPGKILKVNFKVGDAVLTQSTLIVMEAMKMEYNLMAPLSGMVESVSCRVGETVELNQLLVVIKKGE